MNTSIPVINLENDRIPESFKPAVEQFVQAGEVIHYATLQRAPEQYLRKAMRTHLCKNYIGAMHKIGWCFILPAIALSFVSLWWLLIGIPGVIIVAFILRIYLNAGNRSKDSNGLFLITNMYARYIAGSEVMFGGTIKDVANGKPFDSYITSSEFKIGPNMVTNYQENADGTAMIDFDKNYLSRGSVPSSQSAWQFVTQSSDALAILEQLSKI